MVSGLCDHSSILFTLTLEYKHADGAGYPFIAL